MLWSCFTHFLHTFTISNADFESVKMINIMIFILQSCDFKNLWRSDKLQRYLVIDLIKFWLVPDSCRANSKKRKQYKRGGIRRHSWKRLERRWFLIFIKIWQLFSTFLTLRDKHNIPLHNFCKIKIYFHSPWNSIKSCQSSLFYLFLKFVQI